MTSSCVACSGGSWRLDSGPMSRTFLAILHFDGTGFVGWQRQPVGRSVQGEFERILERLFQCRVVAHASGRTDAGVHAQGIGVSFPAPSNWQAPALLRALNATLPRDCWIEAVHLMQPGFHARKSAISRRYRYDIGLDEAAASPFRRPFEWALIRPLDRREARGRRESDRRTARLQSLCREGAAKAPLSLHPSPLGMARASRWARCELSRRGRPLPPSHGAHAGRHDGGHRSGTAPGRRPGDAARAGRQPGDESAGTGAGTLFRGGHVSPGPLRRCRWRGGACAGARRIASRSSSSPPRSAAATPRPPSRECRWPGWARKRRRGRPRPRSAAPPIRGAPRSSRPPSGPPPPWYPSTSRRGARLRRGRRGTSSSFRKEPAWCRGTAPDS